MKIKLIKILKNFDKESICIGYDNFYKFRNLINFEDIQRFSDKYFEENYVKYNKKYSKKIIENIISFMHEKENLTYEKVLEKESGAYYINKEGYEEYLNPFNSIERFFKKYDKTLTFIFGLITGGGIIAIIKLFI